MPKIGMRIIKTTSAVFLCFIVYLFRKDGIPFYSAIAAVLCMQQDMKNSKEKAKSRLISTLIGGILGIPVLWFLQEYDYLQTDIIHYTIVSIMIIPALYIPVCIKQPQSSYLCCVVFMSITVSHIQDENPFIFGINRMVDTLIGIGIALFVNKISIHKPLNQQQTCSIYIDNEKDIESLLKSYEAYHLHKLLQQKANIVFITPLHPFVINDFANSFHVSYYAFDGALKYNSSTQLFEGNKLLNTTLWKSLYNIFKNKNMYPFIYTIKDGVLYIHYENLQCNYMHEIYNVTKAKTMYRYQFHKNIMEEIDDDVVCLEFYINEKDKFQVIELLKKYPDIQYLDNISYDKYCIRVFMKQENLMDQVEENNVTLIYQKNQTLKEIYKILYPKSLK